MIKIQNYDSRASISEYTIGKIYSFYIHKNNLNRLKKVREEDFNNYIKTLNTTIENHEDLIPNNDYLNFVRVIGIVVDKYKSNNTKNTDNITVMFKTDDKHYVLNKYAVNTNNVFTNEKDNIFPSAVIFTARGW